MDTKISLIQLIKSGEISVQNEISKIKGKSIDIKVRTYLERSNHYQAISSNIQEARKEFENAKAPEVKSFFEQKLENLKQVENNFIANTLYLAQALANIPPRTEKLKKAIELFEQAQIEEADKILNEANLLDDQFSLIAFVEYQKLKIKTLENDLRNKSKQS